MGLERWLLQATISRVEALGTPDPSKAGSQITER